MGTELEVKDMTGRTERNSVHLGVSTELRKSNEKVSGDHVVRDMRLNFYPTRF